MFPSQMTPKLKRDPSVALIKNTLDGGNRSAMVSTANMSVPIINPNWTADVRCPKAVSLRSKLTTKSLITPLPANQSEVQQNCEKTITGRMHLGGFIWGVGE